jgi:hypothetical protein
MSYSPKVFGRTLNKKCLVRRNCCELGRVNDDDDDDDDVCVFFFCAVGLLLSWFVTIFVGFVVWNWIPA